MINLILFLIWSSPTSARFHEIKVYHNQLSYLNPVTVCQLTRTNRFSLFWRLIRPPILVCYILSNFGLSDRYVNWFQNYLSSRFSAVRTSGNPFSPSPVLSGVLQGSTSEPLLFRFAINSFLAREFFFPNFCYLLMI